MAEIVGIDVLKEKGTPVVFPHLRVLGKFFKLILSKEGQKC